MGVQDPCTAQKPKQLLLIYQKTQTDLFHAKTNDPYQDPVDEARICAFPLMKDIVYRQRFALMKADNYHGLGYR